MTTNSQVFRRTVAAGVAVMGISAAPAVLALDHTPGQPPALLAQAAQEGGGTAAKPQPPPVCSNCGVISGINVVEKEGEGSAVGVIGGAVVGGLLGNQIGKGTGKTVATVAGAAGGAYAGNVAEKHLTKKKYWDVSVKMEDGSSKVFSLDAEPQLRPGDKVRIVDGKVVRD